MVTPTFIVNSAFDYWQTSCILAAVPEANATIPPSQFDPGCSDIPGWRKGECGYEVKGKALTSTCNPSQMRQIADYQVSPESPDLLNTLQLGQPSYSERVCLTWSRQDLFKNTVRTSPAYRRAGSGSFITSCYDHCGAMSDDAMLKRTVQGARMNQALWRWFQALQRSGRATHVQDLHHFADCTWWQAGKPCNPTCSA